MKKNLSIQLRKKFTAKKNYFAEYIKNKNILLTF